MTARPVESLIRSKKIYEITNPRMVKVTSDASINKVLELMKAARSGYAVVADDNKVAGIFTDIQVMRHVLGQSVDLEQPISDVMVTDPVVLKPSDSVGTAMETMVNHAFYHIPLVDDDGQLAGVLSVRSLIRFLAEFYPNEVYNLPPDPQQIMASPEGG